MPGNRSHHIPLTVAAAIRNRLAAALLTCLVAACGTTGWEAEAPVKSPVAPEAAAAFAGGDYAAAAAAWESEALTAPPDLAATLRVNAADAWLLAGRAADAERALRGVAKADLAPPDEARLNLVLADLALWAARPDEAEVLLQQAASALPASSQGRYRDLQERSRNMRSNPASMGLARARQLAGGMQSYDATVAVELMQSLENVSSGELSVRAANPRVDQQWVGWLDLALVIRSNLVIPDAAERDVGAWKRRHPYHMLTESEALDTWLRYRQSFTPPGRTAVLLPDTGGLRRASDAIRDGLLSAYLAQPGRGELLFYPTLEDEQSTIAAYLSAFDAGARQIIGPLRKEAVETLLNLPGLATPVLALNELPDTFVAPPELGAQLAGLSLSQEAEVKAIAAHAAASGFQRAIVIAPESAWGERMATAFEAEFLQGERQIIAATRYLESENDHSAALERVLLIDESKARAQQLENVLQMPLEFEPMRRTDVDVIFMPAIPNQAKLLRPQLRFLDAGDVPVYATSRVYTGQPDPARNQDLDGVRFPTTPWELAHGSSEDIPELASLRGGTMASLFALGQDAWSMLTWLGLMRKDPGFVFRGQSGSYRINTSGRIEREPAWAEFELGRPVPVDAPINALPNVPPEMPAADGSRTIERSSASDRAATEPSASAVP